MTVDAQTAFISYSRQDAEFALRLAGDLKGAGVSVWLDQLDIAPGQRWTRAVEDALHTCPRMLVILSPASIDSKNVEDEVSFALDEGKTVIPLLHGECQVPFRLRCFQYVDFRTDYGSARAALVRSLAGEFEPSRSLGIWTRYEGGLRISNCLNSIFFLTPELGWIVGDGIMLRTKDAGTTWQDKTFFPGWLTSVCFVTPDLGWVAGDNGAIFRTKNGGLSWEGQASGTKQKLRKVKFLNTDSGWLLGDGVLRRTDNGGRTWNKVITEFDDTFTDIHFLTSESCWLAGPGIIHTEDRGSHWTQQARGQIQSLVFPAPESGWAVGYGCLILHSNDRGRTWSLVKTGYGTFLSIAFPTPQFGCVVGGKGLIFHTSDGGGTWEKQETNAEWDLRSVSFPTPSSGWAVGTQGTILRWEE